MTASVVGCYQVVSVEHFVDGDTLHPFGDDPQGFLMVLEPSFSRTCGLMSGRSAATHDRARVV